jgi:mono/diheme cytochrome c family protein
MRVSTLRSCWVDGYIDVRGDTHHGQFAHATKFVALLLLLSCLILLTGCDQGASESDRNMKIQPRFDPMEPTNLFPDGRSERPKVEGTIARGQLRTDTAYYEGVINGKPIENFPPGFTLDAQALARGHQRFNIYCSVCHGRLGDGEGMIVKRGFRHPPNFHDDRLRNAPIGHFYEVMTHGYGAMFDYADRIAPDDRWAIAAYVRALQLSQHADVKLLSAEDRRQLEASASPATTQPTGGAQ